MHVKRKCASGPFWEKMNSEIFSYLEFHTQDEKARAEVRSFRQKHVFSLFEHFLDDLDDLISLFKCSNWSGAEKRGWKKGGRNGWKDQGLVQSIRSTKNWMSTYWHGSPTIIEKGFMEKKFLMVIFSWNFHPFPPHYWYCPFFPTFCVIAPLNQSGDGDMECFWSNQFFPL